MVGTTNKHTVFNAVIKDFRENLNGKIGYHSMMVYTVYLSFLKLCIPLRSRDMYSPFFGIWPMSASIKQDRILTDMSCCHEPANKTKNGLQGRAIQIFPTSFPVVYLLTL